MSLYHKQGANDNITLCLQKQYTRWNSRKR